MVKKKGDEQPARAQEEHDTPYISCNNIFVTCINDIFDAEAT